MKNKLLVILSILIFNIGCADKNTSNLNNYLKSFNLKIKDYNVICFVPIDGCGSCISPSLDYAKNTKKNYLLVMTSMYKKTIDFTIEKYQLENSNYLIDLQNLGIMSELSSSMAPCFYFLEEGKVVKKVNLEKIPDKTAILKDVEKYLSE